MSSRPYAPTLALATATLTILRDDREPENTFGLPDGTPIRKELRAWLARQKAKVLGTVKAIGTELPRTLPDPVDWTDPMSLAMTPILGAYWSKSGRKMMARVGLEPSEWDVSDPNLAAMIRAQGLEFCRATNETTKLQLDDALTELREQLAQGLVDHGESVRQLTKRVESVFADAATWRARRIAITEASRAVHAATLESARQSGVVAGFEWLASAGSCELCLEVAAKARFIRLDDAFAIAGRHAAYSTVRHPPLHPHCRCSMREVLKPEYGGPAVVPWAETWHLDGSAPKPAPAVVVPKPKPEPEPEKPASWGERFAAYTAGDAKLARLRAIETERKEAEAEWDRLAARADELVIRRVELMRAGAVKGDPRLAELDREHDETLAALDAAGRRHDELGRTERARAVEALKAGRPIRVESVGLDRANLGRQADVAGQALAFLNPLVAARRDGAAGVVVEWNVRGKDETQRAYASGEAIYLTARGATRTAVHELGHALLEVSVPGVVEAERAFWNKRVGAEPGTNLGEKFPGLYRKDEVGYKDDFEKATQGERSAYYVGKHYKHKQYELVSMGVELLFEDAVGFARRDPEYCKFILGILDGELRLEGEGS